VCATTEVDACTSYPCLSTGTGGPAICTDLPYPAPNSAAGRTCSCAKPNSVYTNETTGCVDVNACASFPCSQGGAGGAATCADVAEGPNSAAGRACTCTNGGLYADATGCPVVGKLQTALLSESHTWGGKSVELRSPLLWCSCAGPIWVRSVWILVQLGVVCCLVARDRQHVYSLSLYWHWKPCSVVLTVGLASCRDQCLYRQPLPERWHRRYSDMHRPALPRPQQRCRPHLLLRQAQQRLHKRDNWLRGRQRVRVVPLQPGWCWWCCHLC
jgi:hypothetical protein